MKRPQQPYNRPPRLPMTARRAIGAALAAVLAHAPLCATGAPPLGRLFTTPQQRAQLDAQRDGAVQAPPSGTPPDPANAAPPPPAPAPLVLNGVVRPAHGKPTVWLNQQPVADGVLRRDGSVTFTLPSGRRVTLKPGQRLDESSGEVRDASQ